jgi:O-antigen ligase
LVGVWLASRSPALTRLDRSLEDASEQGRRLALALLVLALLSAGLAVGGAWLLERVRVPAQARRAAAPSLVALVAVALLSLFVRFGGPATLAQRAYDEFKAPPPTSADLNARLFNVSSPARYHSWKVAWRMVDQHPALGAGAGTYERHWHRYRPTAGKIRDAHSLYLEMLAELGPVGLGFLLLAAGVPLAIGLRARCQPLVPAAFGAYLAYLVHAGVDWDWELPAVTLTALLCGAAILVAARNDETRPLSARARAGVLVMLVPLAAFTVVGLIGNSALAASKRADDRRTGEAEARKAMRWAPWSANAIEQLGEVQFEYGDLKGARRSFRRAIAENPQDWDLWFDLAVASEGKTLREAVARASRLNPLDPELAALREALELQDRPAPIQGVDTEVASP